MTDHTYTVKYVVVQKITVRTESDDPEAGREELKQRTDQTRERLRETFIQGIGLLQCGDASVMHDEHHVVRGSGGKV